MHISGINIKDLLGSIAARLAHESDDTQAAFLNIFARELSETCQTSYATNIQLCFIYEKLDPNAKMILHDLCSK